MGHRRGVNGFRAFPSRFTFGSVVTACFQRGTCLTVRTLSLVRSGDNSDEYPAVMPGLHPGFGGLPFPAVSSRASSCSCVAIPTVPGGGNHTREFTHAVSTDAAHEACYDVSKALAHVGMRVLTDDAFLARVRLIPLWDLEVRALNRFTQVKATFEEDKKKRGE